MFLYQPERRAAHAPHELIFLFYGVIVFFEAFAPLFQSFIAVFIFKAAHIPGEFQHHEKLPRVGVRRRVAVKRVQGSVGRTVVYSDYFKVALSLGEKAVKAFAYRLFRVVSRDYYRNFSVVIHVGILPYISFISAPVTSRGALCSSAAEALLTL